MEITTTLNGKIDSYSKGPGMHRIIAKLVGEDGKAQLVFDCRSKYASMVEPKDGKEIIMTIQIKD